MAEVLLARVTGIEGFERHVVIKRIRAEQARDKSHVQMFLEEARLAATLHHHNVVQVHDIGEEQGEYFFVMEYVHGEDVRRILTAVTGREARAPLEHVLTIITGAAAGLHHAHEQCGPNRVPLGIVHRDVSPENILVGYDGGVKVADFGIAKASSRSLQTESGIRKGKVAYMSPEQCLGLPVDRRSDIFALGIVLYESLTTRRLFKEDNDFLTMTTIVQSKIPPPSTVWPQIPPELEQIVMKALSPLPGDRYATADELRRALEAFAAKFGLQTSTTALADYMKAKFGQCPEPWLIDDDEPEIELSTEFDGSASGGAPVAKDEVRTLAIPRGRPTPSVAFAVAHGTSSAGAPAQASAPSTPEPQAGGVRVLPACVSQTRPARRRSRWFAVAAAAVIAAAIGLVLTPNDQAVAASAAIQAAAAPSPSGPSLVTADQAPVLPAPSEPPPAGVPSSPAEIPGSAPETSTAVTSAQAPPGKRHRPRHEATKKHWDAHILFPR
jgi:serine/threonine protein kinase